ncbi:MAG: HEAT repeat domain-containing protein [Ktedonobacteraceae bacterium]
MNESNKPEEVGETESQDSTPEGYLGNTPPPDTPPERGKRAWVDRPEQLLHAVSVLAQASVVAVDAEFTQVRSRTQVDTATSSQRLALLQLAVEHECFVVDALRLHDLSPLKEVVENPAIVILLHGAGADLRVMGDRDLNVLHYYDLEAASRSIFGQHESSLAAMLQRALHVRLDKSLQRTDWSRRPLPPAMVAYAARDAEMTLALYHWLAKHYDWALQLHDYTTAFEPVAAWIEPFLRSTSSVSAEAAVAEAKAQGLILSNEQIVGDCRAALTALTHPMHRSRLLRLIADLSLKEMAPDIESLLLSPTSDERSASVRTLGRLGIKEAGPLIRPLLQDPVQDVRKAAQTALRNLSNTPLRTYTTPVIKLADGARSWTVGETKSDNEDDDWKARLRSMME